jgi:hypothetical protein
MKKGMALTWTTTLILMIVGLLVISIFAAGLLSKLGESFHDSMCGFSAFLHSMTGSTKISCTRKFVTISDSMVELDGKIKRVKIGDRTVGTFRQREFDEAVQYTVADQMLRCFKMFGEGKYDLVDRDFFSADVLCYVCSQISFSDSAKGNTVSGLDAYMRERTVNWHGDRKTYQEIIGSMYYTAQHKILWVPFGPAYLASGYELRPDHMISTDEQYLVVFLGAAETWWNKFGITLGSAYDRSKFYYTVNIYTKEEANKACGFIH